MLILSSFINFAWYIKRFVVFFELETSQTHYVDPFDIYYISIKLEKNHPFNAIEEPFASIKNFLHLKNLSVF